MNRKYIKLSDIKKIKLPFRLFINTNGIKLSDKLENELANLIGNGLKEIHFYGNKGSELEKLMDLLIVGYNIKNNTEINLPTIGYNNGETLEEALNFFKVGKLINSKVKSYVVEEL